MAKRGLGAKGMTRETKLRIARLGAEALAKSGKAHRFGRLEGRIMRWRQLAQQERARALKAKEGQG